MVLRRPRHRQNSSRSSSTGENWEVKTGGTHIPPVAICEMEFKTATSRIQETRYTILPLNSAWCSLRVGMHLTYFMYLTLPPYAFFMV